MNFIDTHCHVHFNAYKKDMDEVIRRSLSENVFMITVGTQTTTSRLAVETAERYDGVWAAIGLHPNHTVEQEFFDEEELDLPPFQGGIKKGSQEAKTRFDHVKTRCESFDSAYYRELAKHPKVVAIGEFGLDYYRIPENVEREEVIARQKVAARAQLAFADELDLPVIIHSRDAHQDQFALLKEFVEAGKLTRRGVVHCFTGTLEQAQDYLSLGFLISFTGIITFPPKKNDTAPNGRSPLQNVVAALPLEAMMVETDAPYLAPQPVRGERNEPRFVKHVAEKIAELKGLSLEEVATATNANARLLFQIDI